MQWQTTWDRVNLFASVGSRTPLEFGTPGPIGDGHIAVNEAITYQTILGFGGALSG